ncbi:MFS transporter [Salmonella enterica subsp. diarizonae]|nr:MFS transporter [Salmonella enterica]ECG8655820.1 MFS transporter [Salmonella enterica subsp. diarizonae]EDV3465579.1 MFS transporter [Salmonella enterica subsp. diarizonae]EDY1997687.1 MFS transporter [Salmonella enterica subsp. diarizonae]
MPVYPLSKELIMLKYIGIGANELDTYLDYALLSIVAIYLYDAMPSEMGLLGACFALPFLFSSNFLGKLLDNGYTHHWRSFFFTVNSFVTPVFILTGSVYGLLAIAFIKTTVRCGLSISNVKLNENDDESKRFYEIYGYLINFSRILVPVAVVALYNLSGIWSVIVFSSSLNALSLLCELISLRRKEPDEHSGKNKNTKEEKNYSFTREMKNSKNLFYLVSGYTVANFAFFLSNDMLGLFFKHIGENENSIGLIISLLGIGGVIGTKTASLLNKKLTSVVILTTSVMINTLSFAIFGFVSGNIASVYIFYGSIILIGISSGVTFFSIRFGVREIIGFKNVGKATGTIQMISSVVAITMPLIGGYIANVLSLETTFRITSSILLALLLVMSWNIYSSKQKVNTHEQSTKNE